MKATDEETFNFVQKVIKKIWDLVKSIYSKINPDSTEGQFSREHKDSLERVYDAFAKMIYTASENLQWTGGQEGISSDRFSVRDTSKVPDDISNFVDVAISNKKSNSSIEITTIKSWENRNINALGNPWKGNYTGAKRIFSSEYVRHVIKQHGNPFIEALRGQLHMDGDAIKIALSNLREGKGQIIKGTYSERGMPTILTEIPINGYTLYAEEPLQDLNATSVEGRTMYMTSTSTRALIQNKSANIPQRKSGGHRNIISSKDRIVNGFLADSNEEASVLYYPEENHAAFTNKSLFGLYVLTTDKTILTDYIAKGKNIQQAKISIQNPYVVTPLNPVITAEDIKNGTIGDQISDIKKHGYDAIILDYKSGDNYMVLVFEKDSILTHDSTNDEKQSTRKKQDISEKGLSYASLVALPDLTGTVLKKNQQVKMTPDGKIDDDWLCNQVFSQCETVKTNAPDPVHYLHSDALGKNVEITMDGIRHGYHKSNKKTAQKAAPREILNARATLNLHDLLKTAVVVNLSTKHTNKYTPYAYVMMSVMGMEDANGTVNHYAVRMLVQERLNDDAILVEAEVLGRLSAVNAKKIDTPHLRNLSKKDMSLRYSGQFGYSVADLLADVKSIFPDTFTNDVYANLGMKRKTGKELADHLVYQTRKSGTSTRSQQTQKSFNEYSIQEALWESFDHADKGHDNLILVSKMPNYIVDKFGIERDFYIYRNHAYENMVSKEQAIAEGRPTRRSGEEIHFHDLGVEKMTKAIQSIDDPTMVISMGTEKGNPKVMMILDEFGNNEAPLYAMISFYADKGINGSFEKKPHLILTIAERGYFSEGGRAGYDAIIRNAIKDGRILDFNEKKRDDLSVIANPAGVGNITKSSLEKSLTRFRKEIKAFREKNNIQEHRGRFCVLTVPFPEIRESPLSSETKSKDLVTRDKCLKKTQRQRSFFKTA